MTNSSWYFICICVTFEMCANRIMHTELSGELLRIARVLLRLKLQPLLQNFILSAQLPILNGKCVGWVARAR